MYPQFLRDDLPDERILGIQLGAELLKASDRLFYPFVVSFPLDNMCAVQFGEELLIHPIIDGKRVRGDAVRINVMEQVFICSPYRGDIEHNVKVARDVGRIAAKSGYVPVVYNVTF